MYMENIENSVEQPKLKFIYRNNHQDRQVVFECIAENILEADVMYEKEIGKDVSKQPHIACSFEKIDLI